MAKALNRHRDAVLQHAEHHHRLLAGIARHALDVVGDLDRAGRQPRSCSTRSRPRWCCCCRAAASDMQRVARVRRRHREVDEVDVGRACGTARTASRRAARRRRGRSRRSWSSEVKPFGRVGDGHAHAGGEVDAVVAGAAGQRGWASFFQLSPCAVLRGRRGRAVVALGAVAQVLREQRLVVQHAAVVVVLLGQVLAHVDLVDVVRQVADRAAIDHVTCRAGEGQRRGVDGRFGPAVLALLGVADHAVAGFVAAPPWKPARRTLGVVARECRRACGGTRCTWRWPRCRGPSPSRPGPVAGMKS